MSLRKILKFHLMSWCGNFVERHSLRIVSGDSPETMRKLCLSTNFHTMKLGEITVFYTVCVVGNYFKLKCAFAGTLHW